MDVDKILPLGHRKRQPTYSGSGSPYWQYYVCFTGITGIAKWEDTIGVLNPGSKDILEQF